jgi:hypothetical protein
MNQKIALTALAALALVAGCNSNPAETANGANSADGSANGSGAAAGSEVTQAALIGTWGQDNCTNTMTFAADGTATSTSAQQSNNRWSLDGSTIVIASPGEADVRMPATIVNGELHLNGGGGEGASTTLTRCPANSGAAAATAPDGENESAEEAPE